MIESPLPQSEVSRRLKITVKHTPKQFMAHDKLGEKSDGIYLFNGLVSETGFSISLMIEKPENFYPIINGKIVDMEDSSIIELNYQLFNSIKLFYTFWTLFLIGFAVFSIIEDQPYYWAALSMLLQIGSFLIILSRFREGVKKSRKELLRLLK